MASRGLRVFKDKGFTLVELLVAATIIGILAVFATNSYRNGVAETRWAQAKANLEQLAAAVQRVKLDYPAVKFSNTEMSNTTSDTCSFYPGVRGTFSPAVLIPCGYLEGSDWNSEYFQYYVCDNRTSSPCKSGAIACVGFSSNAKVPSRYKNYTYCYYGGSGGEETLS